MTATLQSKISVPSSVYVQPLVDETVILDTATGKYYGLDNVGARIWNLLVEHRDVGTAFNILLEEYNVEAPRLEKDLLELVDKLADMELVKIEEAAAQGQYQEI